MISSDPWQIGSRRPPAVCLVCGSKFDDNQHKIMGPYLSGPYIWVCKKCHDLPFMFFPDKQVTDDGFTYVPKKALVD